VNLVHLHIALFGVHLPPRIAAILTWIFIVYLFRRDFQTKPHVTRALWIPLLWLFIVASRPVSQWFSLLGLPTGGGSLEAGTPLDATFDFVLITAGVIVLTKRQINLAEVFRNNVWLTVFLLYCFISIAWSDFPFVTFKRWFKLLGNPIMVLIIFSEPDTREALITLAKRCAYVLVPLSILFIKYYPSWGRSYDEWSGDVMICGVANNKNMLGCGCLVFGLFFFWHLLKIFRADKTKFIRNEFLNLTLLCLILWLLWKSHSATSLVAFLVAVFVMTLLGRRFVNRRLVGTYVLTAAVFLVVAQLSFGLFSRLIELVGRNSTLTGRVDLWKQVLTIDNNPILGAGYQSFWLGDRLKQMWSLQTYHVIQAHNGYLEIYLDLGLLGLAILVGLILATFCKSRRELLNDFEFGRLRLGFLAAIVVYNWTEASFQGKGVLFLAFWIIAMDYPRNHVDLVEEFPEIGSPEEMELTSG
jgi:Lipid A core - O-antigen ligase and related enzymes